MQAVARIITEPTVVWAVVCGLFLWAILSGATLFATTRRLIGILRSATKTVSDAPDELAFARDYEAISTRIKEEPVLRLRWQEYASSLVKPRGPHARPIRSTTRPADWFNLGLMRSLGTDLRYHAALPNLLVGAGLLFTFVGLAAALSTASGVVGGPSSTVRTPPPSAVEQPSTPELSTANPSEQLETTRRVKVEADQRNKALKDLLDTASFKFTTSLVGLLLSILYALHRKRCLRLAENALDSFYAALEQRVPLLTTADLQQEANALLSEQRDSLHSFSNDLAVSLGGAVDQAFDTRLGDHIGPLRESLDRLAEGMSSRNEDAMERMLDAFLQRLQGGAGDRMEGVAASLERLGGRLEGLQSGFGDAALRMADAADGMARRMGEGADQAMSRMFGQMAAIVEAMRSMSERTREAGDEAGRELSARIAEAANGFQAAAREVATSLASAAESMQARMEGQAAEGAARMTAQVEAMVTELRRLAEQSRAVGSDALSVTSERLGAAATRLEETAREVSTILAASAQDTGGALGRGAEEAVNRIAAATEGMRSELKALIEEFRATASAAGDSIKLGGAAGAEALRSSLGDAGQSLVATLTEAAGRLASAGDAASVALRQGGEAAATRLEDAGGAFGGRAEGLARQVVALTSASDGIVVRVGELDGALRHATAPLSGIVADLRGAGEATRAAAEPLGRMADAIKETTVEMADTASRLEQAGSATIRLTDGLAGAANRFAGVDRELEGTVQRLGEALAIFRREVEKTVSETDQHLGRAVTALGQGIKDLQGTLEDLELTRASNGSGSRPPQLPGVR